MQQNTQKDIYLLVDYRSFFFLSLRYSKEGSMDVVLIKKIFEEFGYNLTIRKFSEINFRHDDFNNKYVLYQSAEDRSLLYKSYIEDIVLGLQLKGAILIPNFYLFRAHNNKVFMEILRDLSDITQIKNIVSRVYGTLEEFLENTSSNEYPVLCKSSEGSGSSGVLLAKTTKQTLRNIKKISRSLHYVDAAKNIAKYHLRKFYTKKSNYRNKFIVQNFIPNLKNDFKVLVFGDKHYVLFRKTRKNDFRASGSGLFIWPENIPEGLLDFARSVFIEFHAPCVSMDIAFNGKEFFLLEFQFVHMGPLTLEKSEFYFKMDSKGWRLIREKSILEREFVLSVIKFIENKDYENFISK